MDWNYPFDFCGSIYRQDDLNLIIEGILESKPDEMNKILKPNSFEYIGNLVVKRKMLAKNQPYAVCLNNPILTLITINKVQDVYKTPVYKLELGQSIEESKSGDSQTDDILEYLNKCLLDNKQIDLSYYRR